MTRARRVALALGVVAFAMVGAAACGGGKTADGTGSTSSPAAGKQGGKLIYLASNDVDFLDPGQAFYTFSYMVHYAVNRTLYGFKAGESAAVPDLAEGPPEISADNTTITVKIKKGVRYSPPVNREVTSADIKYAFERAFSKNVPNGYAGVYFQSIVGAPQAGTGPIRDIPGIQAPDPTTLVITLKDPVAPIVTQALVMPITTPVPKEYAQPFDASNPTKYGDHVTFSGPYMVKNDDTGKLTGYSPGKVIQIVRNPNWDTRTDFRPAYLDEIEIQEGNNDTPTATRRALTGSHVMCCDYGSPPAAVLGDALKANKDQLDFIPGGSTRYIAFNTTIKPFDNLNIRKAILAAFDRTALRLTRGGEVIGPVASGWLPPGMPGFEEAGGLSQNTDLDFLKNPSGDLAVARKYMDAAQAEGLPVKDGKWIGTDEFLTVATNADPGKKTAEAFQGQIEALGFKLNLRVVPQDTLYVKFCGVPKQKIASCPNVSYAKDFLDPQSVLDTTFNGNAIVPQGNANWPQLNVPEINDAMAAAALVPLGPARNRAWAKINHMIAEQAAALPYLWDQTILVHAKDVNAATNTYSTAHDLSFTSLK